MFVLLLLQDYVIELLLPWISGLSSQKGTIFYKDLAGLIFNELIWWLIYLILILLVLGFLRSHAAKRQLFPRLSHREGVMLPLFVFSIFLITLFVAHYTLLRFPNSSDEYIYLFQAKNLSVGTFWISHIPLSVFTFNHLFKMSGLAGRFPPGCH